MKQVFSWAHPSPRRKRHPDRFSRFCRVLSYISTDRPTHHATRSVTISGAHSGEAKSCYCLWLEQVLIGVRVTPLWKDLNARGVANAVSTKRCKIGGKVSINH